MALSVVFEGPECCGKTTQIKALQYILEEANMFEVRRVWEPGGSPIIGHQIRDWMLHSEFSSSLHTNTHLYLVSADRNELFHKTIAPFLEEHASNGVLIGDRNWWSSETFQVAEGSPLAHVRAVQEPFKFYPDHVFYIDLPEEESYIRKSVRAKLYDESNWRDEVSLSRYRQVRGLYLDLAGEYKDRSTVLDGMNSPWRIASRVKDEVICLVRQDPNLNESLAKHLQETAEVNLAVYRETEMNREMSKIEIIENEVRKSLEDELGVTDKEELKWKMREDWRRRGLTDNYSGRERCF